MSNRTRKIEPKINEEKDRKRIQDILEKIKKDEDKKIFLKNTIIIYVRNSHKLLPKKTCDFYTQQAKFCERLLKNI